MCCNFIPRGMSKIKWTRNTNIGKDVDHHCWVKVKWYNCFGELLASVLQS
jgi:hypothetical protein